MFPSSLSKFHSPTQDRAELRGKNRRKMKFLTLFLVLLMLLCLAADKRASIDDEANENPCYGYGGNSTGNHHYIPRQDYNNHGGSGGGDDEGF
ncbi:hypothetical protein L6164_019072 [Bauhinia variegata]|uniref:Uncharacterized protein n=1 Tax=Bauhinia variegata TaxID=167791 RepID=A0ACB9NDY9_BAUVA|nr:hypothetical protein L6164_019072 [Bauhinia variegata]